MRLFGRRLIGCEGVSLELLKFEDVLNCVDVAHLNWFIETYLDERRLKGEARRRTAWALFYAWKNKSLSGASEEAKADEQNKV